MSSTKFRQTVSRFSYALSLLLMSAHGNFASAEFAFNFDLHNYSSNAKFTWANDNRVIQDYPGPGDPVDTYWNSFETVEINGELYGHAILGDPATGFAQEVYTRLGNGDVDIGNYQWQKMATAGSYEFDVGSDPLMAGVFKTGNGATNPRRVIIRQYLSDGEIHQDFLKSRFDYKPVITQSLTQHGKMNTHFVMDMSGIQINEFGTGEMTNTIDFLNDQAPDFDMKNLWGDGIDIHVNGGQYIYFEGPEAGGHHGFYYYADGGEDIINTEWDRYFDFSKDNLWSEGDAPVEEN